MSSNVVNVRILYRQIMKNARFYPSVRREKIIEGIREDFRANRKLEGPQLEKVLWNAVMEKQRLDKWMGTKDAKNPSRLKSDNEIIIDL